MDTTAATQVAPTPFDTDAEEPQVIVEQPSELAVQCVLFVGDILTERQKRTSTGRFGGKLFLGNYRTVPHNIVQRCAITRLRKGMRSAHKNMIDEKQWPLYIQGYTLKNQWNPATGKYEDLVVGKGAPSIPDPKSRDGRENPSTFLLFKEIRPIQELGLITTDGGATNGLNAVVALNADAGITSSADIKEAQFHYFPNWLEILALQASLPERLVELQEHIANRRDQTQDEHLRAIGDAFLLACSDFGDWGRAYVDFQTKIIKETEKFPGSARYDEVAERLFKVLDLTREDKMIANFATQQVDTAQTNALLAKVVELQSEKGSKTDQLLEMMVAVLQNRPVEAAAAVAEAPAPATVEEAKAELDRSTEEEIEVEQNFTDMSAAVVPEDEDATVTAYLENAGKEESDAKG